MREESWVFLRLGILHYNELILMHSNLYYAVSKASTGDMADRKVMWHLDYCREVIPGGCNSLWRKRGTYTNKSAQHREAPGSEEHNGSSSEAKLQGTPEHEIGLKMAVDGNNNVSEHFVHL